MSEFANEKEVTAVATEFIRKQNARFAMNTNKAPLIIPLRIREEWRERLLRHPRFIDCDIVDCHWLAKTYLKGAKAFPLTSKEICVAVLLSAIAQNAVPVLPRVKTLSIEEGRKFRT